MTVTVATLATYETSESFTRSTVSSLLRKSVPVTANVYSDLPDVTDWSAYTKPVDPDPALRSPLDSFTLVASPREFSTSSASEIVPAVASPL